MRRDGRLGKLAIAATLLLAAAPESVRLRVDPAVFAEDCLAPAGCAAQAAADASLPSASAALIEHGTRRRLLRAEIEGLLGWGPELACTEATRRRADRVSCSFGRR